MTIQTDQDVADFLASRINLEQSRGSSHVKLGYKLERMQALLARLGNPQDSLKTAHIAGTKGKGSTAAMTSSILRAAGLSVGLFTSPHISRFEERIAVNGHPIPSDAVITLLRQIAEAEDSPEFLEPYGQATYFEVLTALGWLYFRQCDVDIVVLEVGLGGRLDSTNICQPTVTAITSISRDHTELLGNSLEEIAAEKGGIIKPGVPIVIGPLPAGARTVIEEISHRQSAPLIDASSIASEMHEGKFEVTTPQQSLRNLTLGLHGSYQKTNASVAVMIAETLDQSGIKIPAEAIREGLRTVQWPLRCEVFRKSPTVLLDAAHNWASAGVLVDTLNEFPAQRRFLIFGSSRDKDFEGILRRLGPHFDVIVLTKYTSNRRSCDPRSLAGYLRRLTNQPIHCTNSVQEAWTQVKSWSGPQDLVCCTGSFFVAAELRSVIDAETSAS